MKVDSHKQNDMSPGSGQPKIGLRVPDAAALIGEWIALATYLNLGEHHSQSLGGFMDAFKQSGSSPGIALPGWPRFMSIPLAAAYLSRKRSNIERLCREGIHRFVKDGVDARLIDRN